MADRERDAGALAGIDHRLRISLAQRERLLAIELLAGCGDLLDQRAMCSVRCREEDSLHVLVGERFLDRAADGDLVRLAELLRAIRLEGDPAHKAHRRAIGLRRLDELLAP